MLRLHSAKLKAAGEPPAFYFFDAFSINQHTFFLGSTNDEETQAKLINGLRDSILKSGQVVLLCTQGPTDKPGWEAPAPLHRTWFVSAEMLERDGL